jgi:putative spermidine/putrescine transport system ATP-binding protein
LLLLDEPLANLDARLRDEMRAFIRSLQQRVGITTLYVTHDQAEAMTMSDRIVIMFDGHIHQIGSPRDIYNRPATRAVANFVGQSNLFAGKVVERENKRGVVETEVGRIRCECPPGVSVGTMGHVMLRPEAIRLVCAGTGIAGRITEQHFLGNVVDYRVSLANGTSISVQTVGEEAPRAQGPVGVVWDESRAWLLP